MVKVIWANEAFEDLLQIEEFLGGIEKANPIISGLIARTRQLEQFPRSGSNQPTESGLNHRYLLYKSYEIIYRYEQTVVTIRAIFDTRQDPGNLRL